MISKKDIEEALKNQLALDYNCNKEDFSRQENIIKVVVGIDTQGRSIQEVNIPKYRRC